MKPNNYKVDMLHGPLIKKIITFAIPIAASSILQQLFNSADIAIVGKYCGSQSMAAVGNNAPIINLLIALFTGLSIGANVVIANLIGQKANDKIQSAVNTIITISIISGILLLITGISISRLILELINTPNDVINSAVVYLRVYSLGLPFIMIYNFGSAILRSIGDSKRPLYALTFAGVLNVFLNLLFVVVFDLKVIGVALATDISNLTSAFFIICILYHENYPFRFRFRNLYLNKEHLSNILRIGIPAGLQGIVFSVSNTIIQSAINSFGSAAIAGSAAAFNFECIGYYAINSFNQAAVTFTSQNYSAKKFSRCRKVFQISLFSGIAFCIIINSFFYIHRIFFLNLFTSDSQVLHYALIRFSTVLIYQGIAGTYEITGSTLRGMGYSMTPSVLTILGTCVFRIIWVLVLFPSHQDYKFLLLTYPASWILTGVLTLVAYYVIRKR